MSMERVIILDFGSQYSQLIARRVREIGVYSEVLPYATPVSELMSKDPKGIILSGGPYSVYQKDAPHPDPALFDLDIPMLGICYGMQLLAHAQGGRVEKGAVREYGPATLEVGDEGNPLFKELPREMRVWMSHGDRVVKIPEKWKSIAHSDGAPYAAMVSKDGTRIGIQFHPEVVHTPNGTQILENFLTRFCNCLCDWSMGAFVRQATADIRETGGVDSSVAAALIDHAIGRQLTAIFVDNGLLRMNEAQMVRRMFGSHFEFQLVVERASKRFLDRLKGVTSPERKRKLIGHEFIRVFNESLKKVGHARFLAQGTIYPDVIESVPVGGNPAATIKSHHNVGGLPKKMKFELLEPLRTLFKDEVRKVGEELGLPREMVHRQPFPGPGLAVRILGEVTRPRLRILRQADAIVIEEMKKADWYYKVWQSFAVLVPVKTVGVMGDGRTYENLIALRVVESVDAMTADWVRLPPDLLARISNRIINEVRGVNRVCYDISSKPPATIEWE
jgi:GMP synthase (glutamine-hydrolysing)